MDAPSRADRTVRRQQAQDVLRLMEYKVRAGVVTRAWRASCM
jgi:hypothetical protein